MTTGEYNSHDMFPFVLAPSPHLFIGFKLASWTWYWQIGMDNGLDRRCEVGEGLGNQRVALQDICAADLIIKMGLMGRHIGGWSGPVRMDANVAHVQGAIMG